MISSNVGQLQMESRNMPRFVFISLVGMTCYQLLLSTAFANDAHDSPHGIERPKIAVMELIAPGVAAEVGFDFSGSSATKNFTQFAGELHAGVIYRL